MKRIVIVTFALVLLLPVALQAQMPEQMFHVDIPFAFVAAGMHLPAGHYHVSHPGDPNLLIIQKDDNSARVVLVIVNVDARDGKT